MGEISATWKTRFVKKVFPIAWFGVLSAFFVFGVVSGDLVKEPFMAVAPIVMAVFGFFIMKKIAWSLVDEVHDHGDYLIVKSGDAGERIEIADIMNVSADPMTSRKRITLRLRRASRFGDEISFVPAAPFTLNPFARNPIADDLIARVDSARRAHARTS